MANRKVFISILGTGFYEESVYSKDSFLSSKTRFIQQATLEYLHAEKWSEEDRVLIFLTGKAKEANWDKSIKVRSNFRTKQDEPYQGLEQVLTDMHLKAKAEGVDIADGKDENEMWKVFETISNELHEGDELYFDLTHSFRYLPMLLLVLGNYVKFVRRTTIKHISYGNYEARDKDKNISPIVDLLPLAQLQDWTFAAGQFIESGNSKELSELFETEINAFIKAKGSSEDTMTVRKLIKDVGEVTQQRLTCRGMDIIRGEETQKAKEGLAKMQNSVITPLGPIIDRIKEELDDVHGVNDINNIFVAVDWCYRKRLYQQAATMLEEGIETLICKRHGMDYVKNKDGRSLIVQCIKNVNEPDKPIRESEFDKLDNVHDLIEDIKSDDILQREGFAKKFSLLTEIRNDYNHSGFRTDPKESKTIIKKIADVTQFFRDNIHADDAATVMTTEAPHHTGSVFVNISNHPSASWQEEQLRQAKTLGDVVDYPFPNVEPDWTEEQIAEKAEKIFCDITSQYNDKDISVHVMGEYTLCFALVSRFTRRGIKCYSSTTERIMTENADGTRTYDFKFGHFREYK